LIEIILPNQSKGVKKMAISELLTSIFVEIDDYCKLYSEEFSKKLIADGKVHRERASGLSDSELMTIVVGFHGSGFRTLKHFYIYLLNSQKSLFPKLLSYSRFILRLPRILVPLSMYLLKCGYGKCSGISFIDSTKIAVCGNKRTSSNKVFGDTAKIGKSSMGWFYGFKLHLVVSEQGDILAFCLTTANTDDRKPVIKLAKNLIGKLFGDKGYISEKLYLELFNQNIQLFTTLKNGMKNKFINMYDKLLLRKRSIIETIYDQLKNISQIEHTRHRSKTNFLVNLIAALTAYSFQEKKPSIKFNTQDLNMI
jgi:Transposase DDE domain